MSFESFNNLVQLLTPYLRSESEILVRSQTKIRSIIAAVIYRFVHGHSPEHIQGRLQIATSTFRKYIDILCDILTNRNKLFSTCISIPSGDLLQAIIEDFRDIRGLSNICGAIDGTHIPLVDRHNKGSLFQQVIFSIGKNFIVFFCRVFVMQTKYFEMYVLDNLKECMMEGNSKSQACT